MGGDARLYVRTYARALISFDDAKDACARARARPEWRVDGDSIPCRYGCDHDENRMAALCVARQNKPIEIRKKTDEMRTIIVIEVQRR